MPRETDESLSARILQLWEGGLLSVPVYLWDLDSTVAHTQHRQHMVPAIKEYRDGGPTWDDYAMLCKDDTPIAGSVALMHELQGSHIAVSGRSGCAEQLTWDWFREWDVPVDGLLLRAHGDHTKNHVYKERVVKLLLKAGADVRLFFEDWDEVAKHVAVTTNVPVVGINPFYPEDVMSMRGKGAF